MNNAAVQRGIPSAASTFMDEKQRRWAVAVEELLSILLGTRGNIRDQAVTWDKLLKLNLAVIKTDDLKPVKAPAPAFKVQLVTPQAFSGSFDAVDPATGTTITVSVSDGYVQDWAGQFEAVDTSTMTTVTLTVTGGLTSPDGVYAVVDPVGMATLQMTISAGRIQSVI